jgi:hypothetical protein
VAGALSRHAPLRDLVELPVDEWNQLLEGALVALPPFEKEPGDLRGVLRNALMLGLFRSVDVSLL